MSMGPGHTALTRIFSGASRTARLLTKPDDAELAHRVDRAVRGALEPGGRRGEEEAAAAAGAQLGNGRLGRDQHRAEIEIDGEVEGVHVDALDRGRPRMADVVPHEVEALEPAHRVPHDATRFLVLRQIRHDPVRRAARSGDLAHHALHARGVHVHHRDLRTLAREAKRARASHARGGRGHDPDLSGQAHRESSRSEAQSVTALDASRISRITPASPVCDGMPIRGKQ